MPPGSGKGSNGHERRAIARVMMSLDVQVRLPSERPEARGHMVGAELIDVGRDGRGAAVVVGSRDGAGGIPLGAPITFFTPAEGSGIHGTIVSRIGMKGRYRVGIRVDETSRDRVIGLIADEDR